MSLIVQKYGGTSLSDVRHFQNVAKRIAYWHSLGHRVVVVVSAMAGETNRLIETAAHISSSGQHRDCLDCLLSSGEQVSVAILSLALRELGCHALPFVASQLRFLTDACFGQAYIHSVDVDPLRQALASGTIPVVAGFQGVDAKMSPTTLGRGGSDMTAVVLSVLLSADECQIYTDVDGVYSSDPRFLHQAKRLKHVNFEQMLEMSDSGSKVLMTRSVSLACRYGMDLRVLSSHGDYQSEGTLVGNQQKSLQSLEGPGVLAISFLKGMGRIVLSVEESSLSRLSKMMASFAEKRILVDCLMQNVFYPKVALEVSLSFSAKEYDASVAVVKEVFPDAEMQMSIGYGKLSLIGSGLKTYLDIVSQFMSQLSGLGVVLYMFSHSETKISCLLDEHFLEPAVALLHDYFQLDH